MINFFHTDRPDTDSIRRDLRGLKANDLPLNTGKVMAYVYEPEPEAYRLIQDAYMMFLTENGLDPTAFQSLLKMEQEVIDAAINLLGGTENSAGSFTFGGTESIMLAVKAARDYARAEKPQITRPNIVLPVTAHAAFHKACHYLCIDTKVVAISAQTYTPDVQELASYIDQNTIMVVSSAPSYAHGVMDPVSEIAAAAKAKDVWCHVDACVGGMYLPFSKRTGADIPDFDLSVDGVTSISMDFHKYGYTAKGASCILYKDRSKRKYQIYSCSDWSGYSVVNPTVLSSKTGGSLAACWANMKYLGASGYDSIVRTTNEATRKVKEYISNHPALHILGDPVMNMIAFTSVEIDLFTLAKDMKAKGWYIQVQFAHTNSPTNIHLSINQANAEHIDTFIKELQSCIASQGDSVQAPQLPFSKEIIAQITPEMIHHIKSALNIGAGEAPDDLTLVNRILDVAPPHIRSMMLTEFMNDLLR